MTDKNEIISKIYNDPAGFSSIKTTFEDARKKDKNITLENVKQWFQSNIEQKKQLRGFNSYVANEPKFEYQIDLFFITAKDFPNETYIGGVLCIDIFTKFITKSCKFKKKIELFCALCHFLSNSGTYF